MAPARPVITAVIPTFRGAEHLARNLPTVLDALEGDGASWQVIVVDDGGGASAPLPTRCRLLAQPENRGYGPP